MAILTESPVFHHRSVREWLELAASGQVVLPNFQRRFAWDPKRVAAYLMALLESKPTGLFLVLKSDSPPQFRSRPIHRVTLPKGSRPQELLLDGQQRLTSLWGALTGCYVQVTPRKETPKRFFIRVADMIHDLEVLEILYRAPNWKKAPERQYRDNLVPTDIFWDDPGRSTADASAMQKWCEAAVGGGDGDDTSRFHRLWDSLGTLKERLVWAPRLPYCSLVSSTTASTAIEIFVGVNENALTLKTIEVRIADVQAEYDVYLEDRAGRLLSKCTEMKHYFPAQPAAARTAVAEWMLKVACLKVGTDGRAPKDSHFRDAAQEMFASRDDTDKGERLDCLEADLSSALRFVCDQGAVIEETLPAWPPVHVIAGLQEDLRDYDTARSAKANQLLNAYLWRAFVTDRYRADANNRLLEDFRALRLCLAALHDGQDLSSNESGVPSIPAFDEILWPLPNADRLCQRVTWIKGKGHLGRAVVAATLAREPLDWVTGVTLDRESVRRLHATGDLTWEQIFPAKTFESEVGSKIKRGLNGVVLVKGDRPAGQDRNPDKFVGWIRDRIKPHDGFEVRRRVESHLVSYAALEGNGTSRASRATPSFRYHSFLNDRAARIADEFARLAKLPRGLEAVGRRKAAPGVPE